MALQLIDRDINANGSVDNYFYDAERDAIVVNTECNVTALLDKNNQERNDGSNGYTASRDLRKIAEIDAVTILRLLTDFNIDVYNKEDMPRLKKWLRDRDNRGFTTVRAGSF